METSPSLWATCISMWPPSQLKIKLKQTRVFFCSDGISHVLGYARCLLCYYCALLRRPFSTFLSFRCLYTSVSSPEPSPGWSFSSQERCCSLLIILVALHWARSTKSVFFLFWGAQNWIQQSGWGVISPERKVRLPWPAGSAFPHADKDAAGFPCRKGALLAYSQLVCQDPIAAEPLLSWSACSVYQFIGLFLPRCCWTAWGLFLFSYLISPCCLCMETQLGVWLGLCNSVSKHG